MKGDAIGIEVKYQSLIIFADWGFSQRRDEWVNSNS